jgi:hypothetical protein
MSIVRWRRQPIEEPSQAGQTLVEFALVIPLLLLLAMAVIEFALTFNAFVGLNRASQHAAHTASVMGSAQGTDCFILNGIEDDVQLPNNPGQILQVEFQRTSLTGNRALQHLVYVRSGSTDCTLPDGTDITVPYTLGALTLPAYPEDQRCPVLSGCPSLTPPRSTVDNVGVAVRYRHDWNTPLGSIIKSLPGGTSGWTFTQRNIFRVEAQL